MRSKHLGGSTMKRATLVLLFLVLGVSWPASAEGGPSGQKTLAATMEVYVFPAAGQPNLFEELVEEGISAHKPRKVYVTSWTQADQYVNISETIDIYHNHRII